MKQSTKHLTWLTLLAAAPACLGGTIGDGDGLTEAAVVAAALTNKLDFEGGTIKDGDTPETTDAGLTLSPVGGTLILSPGQTNVIMSIEVDNADEDGDPVVATLIQFTGANKHVEVEARRKSTGSGGKPMIDNRFSVAADVCDGLCNKQFTVKMTETSKLESGKIGAHVVRSLLLDCSEDGDENACMEPVGDETQTTIDPNQAGTDGGAYGAMAAALLEREFRAECECDGSCAVVEDQIAEVAMCLGDAVNKFYADDPEQFDCILAEFQTEVECIESAECGSAEADACSSDNGPVDNCGTPPASFEAALDACGLSDSADMTAGDSFPCRNGSLVGTNQVCDGYDDCGDNTDEDSCDGFATWACYDDSQIDITRVCDGVYDCPEGEDEAACGGAGFQCANGTTIDPNWQCDGSDDCGDGSDELDCAMAGFLCANGTTIDPSWECDDYDDCGDGSDEMKCPDLLRFDCGDGSGVMPDFVCDGTSNCGTDYDEANCVGDQFACMDGGTVPGNYACDGVADCADGTDEIACIGGAQ